MANGWLDGMGAIAGILLGVAIPAQEAMRTRKAIGAHLAKWILETTDAFEIAEAFAQQVLLKTKIAGLRQMNYLANLHDCVV